MKGSCDARRDGYFALKNGFHSAFGKCFWCTTVCDHLRFPGHRLVLVEGALHLEKSFAFLSKIVALFFHNVSNQKKKSFYPLLFFCFHLMCIH